MILLDKVRCAIQVFRMTLTIRHGWFVEGYAVPSTVKSRGPPCQELNTAEHSLALRVEVDVPRMEQALEQSESPILVLAGCFSTATEIPV